MDFIGLYTELDAQGVVVAWVTQDTVFTADMGCEIVTVSNIGGVPEIYTISNNKTQYPTEYTDLDLMFSDILSEWCINTGTSFVSSSPAKDGVITVPFSSIKIGSYFYHGGICLKVSESSYFNTYILNLRADTPVSLCVAVVNHKPLVI